MIIRIDRILLSSIGLWLLIGSVGCAVHDVREEPPDIIDSNWRFSRSGEEQVPNLWWQGFEDPVLDRLVNEGLAANRDLQAAWARMKQAEALARKTGSALFPEVSLEGAAVRSRQNINSLTGSYSRIQNQFSIEAVFNYEADLWRRVESLARAAELDALAVQETVSATALRLTSQIAETWYAIVEDQRQLKLLEEQQEASQTFLELVEFRFGQGLASAVEVYQQREQLASTSALIPNSMQKLELDRNRLAVLLGTVPSNDFLEQVIATGLEQNQEKILSYNNEPGRLLGAKLATLPKVGLPADVLLARPDVAAAFAKVQAADHRLGVAIADRLPALRLFGSHGLQDRDSSELFNNWIWSIAGNLVAPILDGGRRKAEVDRSRAALQEVVASYEALTLIAIEEVENALAQETYQRQLVDRLHEQLDAARSGYRESRLRYATGLIEYLPVLTALQAQQRVERQLLSAQGSLLLARISACRALGGVWMNGLTPNGLSLVEKRNED